MKHIENLLDAGLGSVIVNRRDELLLQDEKYRQLEKLHGELEEMYEQSLSDSERKIADEYIGCIIEIGLRSDYACYLAGFTDALTMIGYFGGEK